MAAGEYENFWLGQDRLVKIGQHELSRYYDSGTGPCRKSSPVPTTKKFNPGSCK